MRLNDFRLAWRHLIQEPAYSLVVILGLSIGFASCVLLLGFVRYSWEYNTHVPDVDNVYLVKLQYNIDPKSPWFEQGPLYLRRVALTAPHVISATSFFPTRPDQSRLVVRINNQLQTMQYMTVFPGFVETLGLQAIDGNLQSALEQPDTVILTENAAIRLFGSAKVLGRTIHAEGRILRVGGILPAAPSNSTLPFEALVGVHSVLGDAAFKKEMLSGEPRWWGKVLIRMQPGASLTGITEVLQRAVDDSSEVQNIGPAVKARLKQQKPLKIALSPLRYAYFDLQVKADQFVFGVEHRGDPIVLAGLAAISVLVLALAAVNYVNLISVRALRRQREIAIRKSIGARPKQLIVQFLAESILATMFAMMVGLLLAWLALPLFSELVQRKLEGIFSLENIGIAIAIAGTLGVLTALYPTWIALQVRPAQVLGGKSNIESVRGMQLRRVMTVMQIAAAMALASIALAVMWQTRFAMQVSPGFDPDPLLIVDLPYQVNESDAEGKKAQDFEAALKAQPGIAGITASNDAVGRQTSYWLIPFQRPDGSSISMYGRAVTVDFFEQYRIKPQAGRLFSPSDKNNPVPLILNAIAARELGFASPEAAIGKTVIMDEGGGKISHRTVIGIAPEIRFHSLREAPRGVAYEQDNGLAMTVRATTSLARAEQIVQELWPRYFPDAILKMHRAKDILAANYAEDERMAKLLGAATAIALAIASFGIYVLAAYGVRQKERQIVLRKLYGARPADIAQFVLQDFLGVVVIGALIALPVSMIVIHRYLAGFVEHAPMGIWPIVIAFCTMAMFILAATIKHTINAMQMSPVNALRG